VDLRRVFLTYLEAPNSILVKKQKKCRILLNYPHFPISPRWANGCLGPWAAVILYMLCVFRPDVYISPFGITVIPRIIFVVVLLFNIVLTVFPKLAGQNSEYIIDRLTTYKNRGEVGNMSSTMWSQAAMLSEQEIETLGKFIEETMK